MTTTYPDVQATTQPISQVAPYSTRISVAKPGLFLILVDQSSSMAEPYAGTTKKDFAALAINRCIYEIAAMCSANNGFKDRCQVGIYGYGRGGASLLLGGPISQVAHKATRSETFSRKVADGAGGMTDVPLTLPIWIEASADGNTPMDIAFEAAAALIQQSWLPQCSESFPPVVINITDGEPDDADQDFEHTSRAAAALTSLRSNHGHVLLFNAHISPGGQEQVLPESLPPGADRYAQFLFRISSVVPAPMLLKANSIGLNPRAGSRGCVYNAGAETLTKLVTFGSLSMAR